MTHALAKMLAVRDGLRWMLEGAFRGHHGVMREEGLGREQRVLDCGCGSGVLAPQIRPEAYIGVDVDEQCVLVARQKHPGHRFRVMDLSRLELEDGSLDAGFMAGVLHHLDDQAADVVVGEIARVLSRDGVFVVWEDVPARNPLNVVGRLTHWLDVGEHIRHTEGYAQILRSAFVIEKQYAMRSGFMDYSVFRCSVDR